MGNIGAGSGSSYPTAFDTQTSQEVNSPNANKTKARAEVANDLASGLIATQTTLGTNPHGTAADVKTYLQAEHNLDGTHKLINGSSISATPGASRSPISDVNGYLAQWMPPGVMWQYAGSVAPTGWLLCDGAAISRSTYAALFAVIGTTFGAGNGSTTFNIPNTARRALVGAGGSGTARLGNTVGSTGGEESHELSINELPSHSHTAPSFVPDESGHPAAGFKYETVPSGAQGATSTSSSGSTVAHNTMQPSLVVNFIIKT